MSVVDEISLSTIIGVHSAANRKTKITCTLGPACWSVEGLQSLIDAGMNVARLNFSHGDHATHLSTLERLRTACANRPGSNIAVMLDTKGPEIRTGVLDPSCGGKLKLTKGDRIEVGTDYAKPCTKDYLACSYRSLPRSVSVGSNILVADGSLMLRVVELRAESVVAEIMNNASFGDRKNMNLPGAVVDLPTLTEKDIVDIQQFGIAHGVDYIAASFVRKGSDIDTIREVLGEAGKNIKIIAKIENLEGLENYDDILSKSDGIMVARGDLGMEIPLEKVFLAQKMMIQKANRAGKPIITATQMLESMINSPRPTRAECSDVANAVLDGSDSVMLSGETANGEYPNEAVGIMGRACAEAESVLNACAQFAAMAKTCCNCPLESTAASAASFARKPHAALVVVKSVDGMSATLVAKYRPAVPVIVVTPNAQTARQVQGYVRGCRGHVVSEADFEALSWSSLIAFYVQQGWCSAGDRVVCLRDNSFEVISA